MIKLLELEELALTILAYMSQYKSVTIEQIIKELDASREVIIKTLLEVKINNYVHQIKDSYNDDIFWNNVRAVYTLSEEYKEDINKFLVYDTKLKRVKVIGGYVWYAVYGTNLLLEKFMHYIQGGICRFNHTEYEGCKSLLPPLTSRPITIPYKCYIGGNSPLWQYKGTMFIDLNQKGKTKGRMYLIEEEQYEDIRDQIGRGREKYNKEIILGKYLGVSIKAVTNKDNKIPSEANIKYIELIREGLVEVYGKHMKEESDKYIKDIFDYRVKLNVDKE